MAVLRNPTDSNDPVNFVATIAFFCCISCVILMLRFKFKATLNILSQNSKHGDVPTGTISGGYRSQREEYLGISTFPETRVKITPSMVKLPTNANNNPGVRPTKSTNDLSRTDIMPVTSSKSTSDISLDPRGGNNNIPNNIKQGIQEKSSKELKKEEKEKKKLEKQQIAEQKAKRKAERDHAKQEAKKKQDRMKLEAKKAQHRAKIEAKKVQDHAKIEVKNTKQQTKTNAIEDRQKAPMASTSAGGSISVSPSGPPGPSKASNRAVSTTSTKSDINRSSGPPPYTELPIGIKNESDNTGNTSFSKPINSASSWDMISQHRQQINRPATTVGAANRKQIVMDLQYKRENNDDPDNSEA